MGRRLREKRGSRTLKEIADSVGLTQMALHRYENGGIPPADALDRLARAFKVSTSWLIYGEGKVAEIPEPYGDLGRSDRNLLDEVVELLREADKDTRRDLLNALDMVRRARGVARKRV